MAMHNMLTKQFQFVTRKDTLADFLEYGQQLMWISKMVLKKAGTTKLCVALTTLAFIMDGRLYFCISS